MTKEEKKIQDASIEQENEELSPEEIEKAKDNKIKNLISATILLAGLFVGSLFVDAVQMVRGGGFSQRALSSTDVFTSGGKTWVAYSEPMVKVQVISDDTCEKCKPDEVLVGLKQAIPTMLNEKIDANSAAGKKLIGAYAIKTLPAFVFSKEIEKTDLFSKAQPFLDKQGDVYVIKSAEAGFPVGKYVAAPLIADNDIKIGANDSEVKVIAFTDFQNPVDAKFYKDVTSQMLKDYEGKIQVVFKAYFPPTSVQGMSAALAVSCANEQTKFVPFLEKLFSTQAAWGKVKDATSLMKSYAVQTGLNAGDFNKCLDGKKYQDLVTATMKDGQSFGIAKTPSVFIGSDLQDSTVKYEDIKKVLDAQLNK